GIARQHEQSGRPHGFASLRRSAQAACTAASAASTNASQVRVRTICRAAFAKPLARFRSRRAASTRSPSILGWLGRPMKQLIPGVAYSRIPPASVATTGVPQAIASSEEHTSELQSREKLVCRLLLEKKYPRTR